ncbi:Protein NMT1-like protein [Hirsutella minnesotensis 3608]|uniref:4-amino-5-hydroxymethyl-2-methylpyrimidine phosphate synthase n=1 Tax=Hirsutella minnesotensis 3608 TaxID=1043627 RepID=A0A0F8A2A2_9HYPO|nr:Protein NMT1-like protein [Hirsutella minnesotensis 3608]
MSTDKITFLTNWHATPYHAPLFLAQAKGFFADEGVKVAILEPNDPSDVTEIIGSGKVDMGFKAMIHTLAAKARGFPIVSVGSLLDEPFTGIVYLKSSGITPDLGSLRGKRIGYVGEFGKLQVDDLMAHHGLAAADYTPVRCGMNVTRAITRGDVDAGIGLDKPPTSSSPTRAPPGPPSFAYLSRDLKNVPRDWDKVTRYGRRLGVLGDDFVPNYTNDFLDWPLDPDSADPADDQRRMADLQKDVACRGGFKRLGAAEVVEV